MAVSNVQALLDLGTTIDAVNADTVVTDVLTPINDSAASTERKVMRMIDAILANAVMTAATETAVAALLRPTAVSEAAALTTYTDSRTEDGRISAIITELEADQPPALFINGTRFNFVDKAIANCGPTEIPVGETLADTLDNINTVLNASTDTDVDDATYTDDNTDTVTITHDTTGTGGNAFTIAAPFSTATASAATLEGGDVGVAATGTIVFTENPSPGEV